MMEISLTITPITLIPQGFTANPGRMGREAGLLVTGPGPLAP